MTTYSLLMSISYLAGGVALLNLFDATLTLFGVMLGYKEGNYLARAMIDRSPLLFFLAKVIVTGLLLFIAYRTYIERYILAEKAGMVAITFGISALVFLLYLLTTVNNFAVVMKG